MKQQLSLSPKESISFVSLHDKFCETERYKNLSDSKKTAYRIAYNKCSNLQQYSDFRAIRFEQMQNTVKGLNYYPARDIKVLLNGMSILAKKHEWCEMNFAELIELPKMDKSEKAIFTDEQLDVLRENASAYPFIDYILLMCDVGLRPIEMRTLLAENVHIESRYMIGGKKTDYSKQTPIRIGRKALIVMQRILDRHPSGLLCDISEDDFYNEFYTVLENVGIQSKDNHVLTPGCCRHTFVTRFTKLGLPVATTQKAARHTKYETTLHYTHIDSDDVLAGLDML